LGIAFEGRNSLASGVGVAIGLPTTGGVAVAVAVAEELATVMLVDAVPRTTFGEPNAVTDKICGPSFMLVEFHVIEFGGLEAM
jgi:hypothetical protein